jgi:hypothetical protein
MSDRIFSYDEYFCEKCGEQWFPGHRCGYKITYEKISEESDDCDDCEVEDTDANQMEDQL